jgi:hypothetical protein
MKRNFQTILLTCNRLEVPSKEISYLSYREVQTDTSQGEIAELTLSMMIDTAKVQSHF